MSAEAETLHYLVRPLAEAGFEVIVPDLRGFGEAYEIVRASCRERV